MAVSIYTGGTESGKSWHVMKRIIPMFKKKIVFDPEGCFVGESIINSPTKQQIIALFRKFKDRDSYTVVIRPGRLSNHEFVFNQVVELSCALGRVLKLKNADHRVQCIVDEVTTSGLIKSGYQAAAMANLISRGRHDFVDSHLIAQNPMAIHNQIRSQASRFCSFYLNSAENVPILRSCFGNFARNISTLPQYWRMEWTNKGEITLIDNLNEIRENFTEKLRIIPGKRKDS